MLHSVRQLIRELKLYALRIEVVISMFFIVLTKAVWKRVILQRKRAIGSFLSKKKFDVTIDVGCGDGKKYANIVKKHSNYFIGIDIDFASLQIAKKEGHHDDLIRGDISRIYNFIREDKIDCALIIHVIEHLEKKDALKILEFMRKIPMVILMTPIRLFDTTFFVKLSGNPFQKHRSHIGPLELKKLGFKVYLLPVWIVNDLLAVKKADL